MLHVRQLIGYLISLILIFILLGTWLSSDLLLITWVLLNDDHLSIHHIQELTLKY